MIPGSRPGLKSAGMEILADTWSCGRRGMDTGYLFCTSGQRRLPRPGKIWLNRSVIRPGLQRTVTISWESAFIFKAQAFSRAVTNCFRLFRSVSLRSRKTSTSCRSNRVFWSRPKIRNSKSPPKTGLLKGIRNSETASGWAPTSFPRTSRSPTDSRPVWACFNTSNRTTGRSPRVSGFIFKLNLARNQPWGKSSRLQSLIACFSFASSVRGGREIFFSHFREIL